MYKSEYNYPDNIQELYKEFYEQVHNGPADSFKQPTANDGRMLFDVDVFKTADKFFIASLKDMAATRFERRCEGGWATQDFPAAIAEVYKVPSGFYTALKTPIMGTVLKHKTELLRNKFRYPAFHAVMRSNADFSTAVAMGVEWQQPEKVYVDQVVEKVVEKVVDRPVDRVVHINDPNTKKYKCPHCGQIFSMGPTPSPRTDFWCPRGCYRSAKPTWWTHSFGG